MKGRAHAKGAKDAKERERASERTGGPVREWVKALAGDRGEAGAHGVRKWGGGELGWGLLAGGRGPVED